MIVSTDAFCDYDRHGMRGKVGKNQISFKISEIMTKTWFLSVQQLFHSLSLRVHSRKTSHRDIHFSKGQPNHQEAASLRLRGSFLEPSHWKHHVPLHEHSNPLLLPPSHLLLLPLFLHRHWKRRHEMKERMKVTLTLTQGSHLRLRTDPAFDHKVFRNCYS